MDAALIRLVRQRTGDRCEYCRMPREYDDRAFEIDHIISRKHKGPTISGNLALSCFRCNSFKYLAINRIDDVRRKVTPLFNPRRQKWSRHFRWEGPFLSGRTAIGRVTVGFGPFTVARRKCLAMTAQAALGRMRGLVARF